jgi:hypothetical protein
MRRLFSTIVVVALLLNVGLPPSPAGPKPTPSYSAFAKFRINPTGCRETRVLVEVAQTTTGTLVNLIYDVQSTCQDPGDFLFYHSITGSDFVPNRDFKVQADGKKATLKTVLPVFDDEGGTDFDLELQVTWKATGGATNGTRPATASVKVEDPFNSPFITGKISESIEASITRTK